MSGTSSCIDVGAEEGRLLLQTTTTRSSNKLDLNQIKQSIGVIDVEIYRRFSPFGLAPIRAPHARKECSGRKRLWSWAFQIEQQHQDIDLKGSQATATAAPVVAIPSSNSHFTPTESFKKQEEMRNHHIVEVSWSRANGIKAGDIILAVGDKIVIGQPLSMVQQCIASTQSSTLRLTIDTRNGWGSTTRTIARQKNYVFWRILAFLDGFEALLDARTSALRKLGLNGLAMLLLLPLIESFFSALNGLSIRNGPLLVSHAVILQFEAIWTMMYVIAITIIAIACWTTSKAPQVTLSLLKRLTLMLLVLIYSIIVPSFLITFIITTSGFAIPPVQTEAAVEVELQSLVTHVLCVLVLPFCVTWYLLRFRSFSIAYADILERRQPKLLGLNMPLSSQFVDSTEKQKKMFHHLRWYGY